MKPVLPPIVDECRIDGPRGTRSGACVLQRRNTRLRVIFSDGMGWDHVSVSLATRCPTWEEMCFVKDVFFQPCEVAMQIHPAKSDYVNNQPFCLHLWRPQQPQEIERIALEWGDEWNPSWSSPGCIPLPEAIQVGYQHLVTLPV